MIYVIINKSHESGDPPSDIIEYISTSIEEVEKIWDKYYSYLAEIDDPKWCYEAELREYPNGYFLYGVEFPKFKVLKSISS